MVRIRPFPAIRPLANIAAQVASSPYDVVSTDQARRLAADNPRSFLHVVRSEIDLPTGIDPHDDAVYAKAGENLQRLITDGVLVREDEPKMYLYRLVMNDRCQTGLVCCCHTDDYARNVIKKHEKTRPDTEDDRTRHVLAVGAHTGVVSLTYRDQPDIESLFRQDVNARPLFHFNAAEANGTEVTHTVWTVSDPSPYCDLFSSLDAAYVADGHHRAASATRAAIQRNAANPSHGDKEYNWFLAALFPASELTILPYHRLVADLAGQTAEHVLDRLGALGTLTSTDQPQPQRPGEFGIYLRGSWHRLALDAATIDHADPVKSLDIALLQERVLEPILGIGDARLDPRIDFVGGSRGIDELQRRVDAGQAVIAFSLYPTSIEQLLRVADAALVMPPKSTWFEPKLRSGLFVHTFD